MSLPVTAIARVGVLTRDCRAAAAEYARFFGVNEWRLADCAGRTADGREYAHRQAVGYVNGVGFELIEPKSGPWADELARCGEGPSHVVIPVSDWAALDQAHSAAGLATAAEHAEHGGRRRLLDSRGPLGGLALVFADADALIPPGEPLQLPGSAILPVQKLYQVSVMVRDLDAAKERFRALLGIEDWVDIGIDSAHMPGCTYYGQPVEHTARLAIGRRGRACFELVEPLSGPTVYRDALDRRGECVHHIMVTLAPPQDFERAAQELAGRGIVVGQSASIPGLMAFAYFDGGKPLAGLFVEVIQPLADDWLERMFPSPDIARIVVGD
ncbi:VOC family protein [Immundisolibacter sp.]|uniref:VOC family protein n=1 Tax=Immundisolibacter sp. TaxID=1934948 RepID=UPI00261C1A22|nr:VOC family protein [Immundisolibacter sp.]MDD3650139.1 VOC family protein [Immundisolibacter sp.]